MMVHMLGRLDALGQVTALCGAVTPPRFPIRPAQEDFMTESEAGTDLRFKLGKGIVVQIRSNAELGAAELEKLLKLIEAQKEALT
jgi:hypothetical protein